MLTDGKITRIGIVAACALLLCATFSRAQVPRVDHVFIVVEENQDFSCVIGNSTMPFLNGLAAKYAVAASYYANDHPSISNYFVLTTGQAIYKGRFGDARTDHVDVDNVIRQLKQNGKTWRSYAEGVPSPGYMGGNVDSTGYVKRHNPLAYFEKDIAANERANLAPFSQFSEDLAQNRLANYSFIVPNLFDDGHSVKGTNGRNQGSARCGDATALKQSDDWLKNIFSPLLAPLRCFKKLASSSSPTMKRPAMMKAMGPGTGAAAAWQQFSSVPRSSPPTARSLTITTKARYVCRSKLSVSTKTTGRRRKKRPQHGRFFPGVEGVPGTEVAI